MEAFTFVRRPNPIPTVFCNLRFGFAGITILPSATRSQIQSGASPSSLATFCIASVITAFRASSICVSITHFSTIIVFSVWA